MAVRIQQISGIYQLDATTEINAPLQKVWDFFSSPENLDAITPPEMGFQIMSGKGEKTFAGQMISYKIQIFPFIKSFWVTEITHYEMGDFFVDEQRFGPYAMWHHEHHFRDLGAITEMRDRVSYKLPFGVIGRLAAGKIIRKKVRDIFEFRNKKITETFGHQP